MINVVTVFWRDLFYDSNLQVIQAPQTTIYEYFSSLMRGIILHDVNLSKTEKGTRISIHYEEFNLDTGGLKMEINNSKCEIYFNQQILSLNKGIKRKNDELSKLKYDMKLQYDNFLKLKGEISILKEENKYLNEKLKKENTIFENLRVTLGKQIDSIVESNKKRYAENSFLKDTVKNLNKDLEILGSRSATDTEEIQALKKELENKEKVRFSSVESLTKIVKKYRNIKNECEQKELYFQKKSDEDNCRISWLENKVSSANIALKTRQSEIESLKEKLEESENHIIYLEKINAVRDNDKIKNIFLDLSCDLNFLSEGLENKSFVEIKNSIEELTMRALNGSREIE